VNQERAQAQGCKTLRAFIPRSLAAFSGCAGWPAPVGGYVQVTIRIVSFPWTSGAVDLPGDLPTHVAPVIVVHQKRLDVLVAREFRHVAQVAPKVERVRDTGMPQTMWRD